MQTLQVLKVALSLLGALLLATSCDAFLHDGRLFSVTTSRGYSSRKAPLSARRDGDGNNLWNGVKELWDEIIEVSTYGPSERKMLKVQRERQKKLSEELEEGSTAGSQGYDYDSKGDPGIEDDTDWLEAFKSAKSNQNGEDTDSDPADDLEFDGYAFRDLLVAKWGAPLDVDFQKIGDQIYCTVLPLLGFGSPLRSRHESELDYLMHLQGVVGILRKYGNLEYFVLFIEATEKTPKRGTDAVLCRLNLSNEQKAQIRAD
mmetsp:Transcript_26920/g.39857  ORF Transcript_26920/g.39857 Transcript_26920/m.39857 type:complete len:259 (+) Transcript_26920:175-951(+)